MNRSVRGLFAVLTVSLAWKSATGASARSLSERAAALRTQLTEKILPYWYVAQDTRYGGYLLADPGPPKEKSLVTQARMVWTFSLAHRKGYSSNRYDYLKAAEQGYRFLIKHFRDSQHGGYVWRTALDGAPIKEHKFVYGQAFVIYALVEYHRASRSQEPLRQARALYRTLQERAYDKTHGGWLEHFTRDWTPLPLRDPSAEAEVAGLKSANTHLHLMEAFTELYRATGDEAVRRSLEETLRINKTYFYPLEAARSCFHRNPDWSAVTDPRSAGLSYGHNVEFAWLMVEAERALGREPSWPHFYAHLEHALQHGWDAERGGLYHRGIGNEPAEDTRKIWWVQAEMLAALTEAVHHKRDAKHEAELLKLLDFIGQSLADPKDGVWYESVKADGLPLSKAKAHRWKANYHDVRALVKLIEAFGVPAKTAP